MPVGLEGSSVSNDDDHVVDDAAWAEIVASFHASPDVALTDREHSGARPIDAEPNTGHPAEPANEQPSPTEEHFEPPTPPPLPTGDVITRLAWSGVIGGPSYLFLCVVAGWAIQPLVGALALIGFVTGFVTLVARMRDDEAPGDDNGAVV